jgi:hypothetical protein
MARLKGMRLRLLLAVLNPYLGLALVLLWLLIFVPPAIAGEHDGVAVIPSLQDSPITYLRYDVDITLKPNGNLIVREIQQIQFNGEYRTAFAEIPRDYTSDITNIQVWEDDTPYSQVSRATNVGTYAVDIEADSIYVDWRYEETTPGDVRTFILQYEVVGGLWVYPDETILEWRAVPADRSGFPVQNSQVTINLPAPVPADDLRYTAYGPEFTVEVMDSQVILTATEPIPDGKRFQVQVGFPPELVAAETQPWQIAEDTAALEYRLEAIDVDLVVGRDGQVAVTEQQRVAVDAGALYSGHRAIRLAYLEDITDVSLFEGEQSFSPNEVACGAYCFRVDESRRQLPWIWYDEEERAVRINELRAGQVTINWDFPSLVKGEVTIFRLQYHVLGAIQVNEDSQRLNWTVVFSDHDVPVESASARIVLPPGVTWEDVFVEGGEMRLEPDGSISLVQEGPLAPKRAWRISLIMPAGATNANKPAWQLALEAAEATARQAEIRRARQQLGTGVAGALILVVGLLAAWLTWYWRGRDRPAEMPAEYISQPPSDLPPGIVAYLVDEKPTPKGVLASLFHMASLGLLRIDLADVRLPLQRNWDQELAGGQSLQTPTDEIVTIPDHLVTLFNALRPAIPSDKTRSLSKISHEFQKALPTVYAEMADEATRFFTELPAAARHHWLSIGQWLVLGGIVSTVGAWIIFVPDLGKIALAPAIALLPVGLVFMLVSRWMPQRTSLGAEEAARWRAFRRYLRGLKDYGDLTEAQIILDDYFAYAVALDVEEVVLKQAEELGGVMPVWTYPARLELGQGQLTLTPGDEPEPGGSERRVPGTRPPQPLRLVRDQFAERQRRAAAGETLDRATGRLSLDGLSRQLGQTLTNASKSVDRLLNTAVGEPQANTPFKLVLKGAGKATEMTWNVTSTTVEVIGDILEASATGEGSGGYSSSHSSSSSRRSSSSSRSSWSSSSSRSSRSSRSSGRSSSSRRSGGGGRRGFG